MIIMPELVHIKPDASIEEILEIMDKDAGLIIDDLVPKKLLLEVRSQLAPYLQDSYQGSDEFSGHKTKRIGALIARSKACQDLAMNSLINNLCSKFLKPFCEDYQLHFTQAISIGSNETEQILHRDRGVWGGYIPRKIETQFSTVWAVDDFRKENGATRLVPGSHKWDKDRLPLPEEVLCAEMKAGSVLIYPSWRRLKYNKQEQTRSFYTLYFRMVASRRKPISFLSSRNCQRFRSKIKSLNGLL